MSVLKDKMKKKNFSKDNKTKKKIVFGISAKLSLMITFAIIIFTLAIVLFSKSFIESSITDYFYEQLYKKETLLKSLIEQEKTRLTMNNRLVMAETIDLSNKGKLDVLSRVVSSQYNIADGVVAYTEDGEKLNNGIDIPEHMIEKIAENASFLDFCTSGGETYVVMATPIEAKTEDDKHTGGFCGIRDGKICVFLQIIRLKDTYPNCDGEHDRWVSTIVGYNCIAFDPATGEITESVVEEVK